MKTLDKKKSSPKIVSPSLYLDLSKSLLNKIDNFVNSFEKLSPLDQKQLYKLFEEVYSEGYTNSLID